MRKVAITHIAMSSGAESKESLTDFTYWRCKEVLDKAGIKRSDVGCILMAASDIFHSGLSCANAYDWDGAGGYMKNGSRCEESLMALAYAMIRIMSGAYDTVLITALVKGSENPENDNATQYFADPFYQRQVGLNETTAAALQMRVYMEQYGITEEQCAKVVVKNLGNALYNHHAHIRRKVTINDVLGSERIADPLKKMECAPKSDGVVSMLIASQDKAPELCERPIWITGYGSCMDNTDLGDRNLLNGVLKKAAERAYSMAGIKYPRKEIDMAEICEPYAFQELLWCEQLGFCGEGQGGKLIDSGITKMDGDLPINPSGGVLATNPYVSRGLFRVAEAALQIRGQAGEHQVKKNVKTALAHSTHGFAGQCHSVVILND